MSLWRRIFAERRRAVLPLGILLVANLVVLVAAVVPLQRSVVGDRAARQKATLDLAQAHRLEKGALAARDSRDQATRELKKFYAEVLPGGEADARHIAYQELQRMGNESGLTLKNGTMEETPVKDSQLMKLTWKATFTGEYPNIRRFLYMVETASQFLAVEDVALEQPNAAQGQVAGLRVTLNISTYYVR